MPSTKAERQHNGACTFDHSSLKGGYYSKLWHFVWLTCFDFSGFYYIDPNQGSPADAFAVYCNFTAGVKTCLSARSAQVNGIIPLIPLLFCKKKRTCQPEEHQFKCERGKWVVRILRISHVKSKMLTSRMTTTERCFGIKSYDGLLFWCKNRRCMRVRRMDLWLISSKRLSALVSFSRFLTERFNNNPSIFHNHLLSIASWWARRPSQETKGRRQALDVC